MVAFEYFGTSVNEAHVFHLGEVTIFAAELEYTAARFAWELIDENPQIGMSVTAGMTFERMNSLIERLIEKRLPSDSGTARHYRSASDLAVKAMRARNRLLHGHWTHSFGSPGESDVITRTRKGEIQTRLNVTVEEIRSTAGELSAATGLYKLAWTTSLRPLGRLVEFAPGQWRRRESGFEDVAEPMSFM